MNKEKFTLILMKNRVFYLSSIILIVGLYVKYGLPILFPKLIKWDIRYFGEILIGFSILFFIGNRLVDKYKEKINRELFSEILNKKLGIKTSPLLTELTNIISPFAYNVISHSIVSDIKRNGTKSKYDTIQTINLKLSPRQDNVHYRFGGSGGIKKPILNYVKINNKNLVLSEDLREINEPYSDAGDLNKDYQIITPLKKNRIYNIEIKITYPECMSDLTDNMEYEYHKFSYFALTERTIIKQKYHFPDFKNYNFKAEKRYMNIPDITDISCEKDDKTGEVILEASNLKNGDAIYLTYTRNKN